MVVCWAGAEEMEAGGGRGGGRAVAQPSYSPQPPTLENTSPTCPPPPFPALLQPYSSSSATVCALLLSPSFSICILFILLYGRERRRMGQDILCACGCFVLFVVSGRGDREEGQGLSL